jgi:L-asparaginase II
MSFAALVEEYRGGVLENVHHGAVSVVDEKGNILYRVIRKREQQVTERGFLPIMR